MCLSLDGELYQRFKDCLSNIGPNQVSENEFFQSLLEFYESNCINKQNPYQSLKPNDSNTSSQPVSYNCPECDINFRDFSFLINHYERSHAQQDEFKCVCGSIFDKTDEFLRHRLNCENEPLKSDLSNTESILRGKEDKPFSCDQCTKSFKSKPLLEQHMHIHYPPRYKCSWCGNLYRWPPVYYHHKQKCRLRPINENHQGTPDIQPMPKSTLDVPNVQNFINSESLSLINSLSSNLLAIQAFNSLINNSDNQTSETNVDSPMIPCVCGFRFKSYPQYIQHLSVCPLASALNDCSQQNSLQTWIQALTTNQQANNDDSKPCDLSLNSSLSCKEPTDDFQQSLSSLRAPYRRKNVYNKDSYHDIIEMDRNAEGKQFRCKLCDKTFSSKLSIKQHIDGKHSDKGKFVCGICNKRYRWGASFYYHRKICGQAHGQSLGSLSLTAPVNSRVDSQNSIFDLSKE